MQLPEEDEAYLKEKGFVYELLIEGNTGLLIIKDYPVSAAKYDRDRTDLLIQIPNGYNISKLDMFWVDPPLKLKASGSFPQAAAYFEPLPVSSGRQWQRFSRHLNDGQWKAGIDGLSTFMSLIQRELHD